MWQVVHHPTIIAMHGEGESWSFTADADVRAKFWGRSVELLPIGLIRLRFDDGDEYNWAKVRLAMMLLAKHTHSEALLNTSQIAAEQMRCFVWLIHGCISKPVAFKWPCCVPDIEM